MAAGSPASMIASRAARSAKALRDRARVKRWTWTAKVARASTSALARLARALSTEAVMAMMPSGSRPRLRTKNIFTPLDSAAQREANQVWISPFKKARPSSRERPLAKLSEQIEHFRRDVFVERPVVDRLQRLADALGVRRSRGRVRHRGNGR